MVKRYLHTYFQRMRMPFPAKRAGNSWGKSEQGTKWDEKDVSDFDVCAHVLHNRNKMANSSKRIALQTLVEMMRR